MYRTQLFMLKKGSQSSVKMPVHKHTRPGTHTRLDVQSVSSMEGSTRLMSGGSSEAQGRGTGVLVGRVGKENHFSIYFLLCRLNLYYHVSTLPIKNKNKEQYSKVWLWFRV